MARIPFRSTFTSIVFVATAAVASAQITPFDAVFSEGLEAFHSDRHEDAIEHFEAALELRPGWEEPGKRLAQSHARLGDVDAALAALERAASSGGRFVIEVDALPDFASVRERTEYAAIREALQANRARSLRVQRDQAREQRKALQEAEKRLRDSTVEWLDGNAEESGLRHVSEPGGDRVVTLGNGGAWLWHSRLGGQPDFLCLVSNTLEKWAAFSPDGQSVLVLDGPSLSASVFDVSSGGTFLQSFDGFARWADFLDDDRLVIVDLEGGLHVMEITDGTTWTLESAMPSYFASRGPDGSILTTDQDGSCRLREVETGAVRETIGRPNVTTRYGHALTSGRVLTEDEDGARRLWTPGSTDPPRQFPGAPLCVWGSEPEGRNHLLFAPFVRISDDERRLATFGLDGIRLWDVESERCLKVVLEGPFVGPEMAFVGEMLVATNSGDPFVKCVASETGENLGGFDRNQIATLGSLSGGRLLMSGPGGVYVFGGGTVVDELCSHVGRPMGMSVPVVQDGRVFLTMAGESLASSGGSGPWTPDLPLRTARPARAWSLVTGEQLESYLGAGARTNGMIPHPTGGVVAFGDDASAVIGDGAERRLPVDARKIDTAAYSPDGERLAATCRDATSRSSWSVLVVSGGAIVWLGSVRGQARSPGDTCTPVFSTEGSLVFAARGTRIGLSDGITGDLQEELDGHTDHVLSLAYSPTDDLLASASSDRTARLWPVGGSDSIVLSGHTGAVRDIAFHPDGTAVATSSLRPDCTVRMWGVDGEPLWTGRGHSADVDSLLFSDDGSLLLSCSADGTARLWDVASGTCTATLIGHTSEIKGAAFVDDCQRAVTLGADGTTRVWEIPSGRLLATHVEYLDPDSWLTFTPGGYYVAGGDAAEWARIRDGRTTYPLSSYAVTHEDPEKVRASLAGEDVGRASLWAAPEVDFSVDLTGVVTERRVRVQGIVKALGGSVEVTRSGRLADGTKVAPEPLPGEFVSSKLNAQGTQGHELLDLQVPIPDGWSEITIRARATSGRGIKSRIASLHRIYEEPPLTAGRLFLVALGVQDYVDDRLDLAYARKDVDDVVATFQELGAEVFTEINVTRLIDGDVERWQMDEIRYELLDEAGPDDTIVVYIAGHGALDPRTGDYFFLTPAATIAKPTRGIPRKDLEALVSDPGLKARRRLMLIDTCHAGRNFGSGKRGVSTADAFTKEEVESEAGSGLYILAASTEAGTAAEADGNGLFTRVLLEGLRGDADADGDGEVDTEELIVFTKRVVKERGDQRVTLPRAEEGVPFTLTRAR